MQSFLNLPILTQIIILYLVAINIVTFFYYGLDKLKARLQNRRISERTLLVLVLIGGSAGALLAMKFFRHKTQKVSFQAWLIAILAVQVFALFYFFM